jgi:malonyl-CoA O-methyltransferase
MTEAHLLDRLQMRRAFDRAAHEYDAHAVLQREVASRMAERLELVKIQPDVVLDAGCGTGYAFELLRSQYPDAKLIGLDISRNMLHEAKTKRQKRSVVGMLSSLIKHGTHSSIFNTLVCGDVDHLPIRTSGIPLIWSNLTLQWVNDPEATFREWHRVIAPGGLLMFSTFGPDTLMELRESFSHVDGYSHVHRFLDMHDVGDALVHAGFQAPVMDMERVVLTYEKLEDLLRDLKMIGAHNVTAGRGRGMFGRRKWAALRSAYERFRRDSRLPATYEVVYGHAWTGDKTRLADGRQLIQMKIAGRQAGLR